MKVMASCGDGQKKPYSGNIDFLESMFDMGCQTHDGVVQKSWIRLFVGLHKSSHVSVR